MINQKEIITQIKKLELKLRSDLCDFNDACVVVKGTITVNAPNNAKKIKQQHLKIMHHLLIVSKKLMVQKLIIQKI